MSGSDYPAGAFEDDNAPFNKGLKNRRKTRIRFRAKYKFRCEGCGTEYSSPQDKAPPSIKWDDGHTCIPIRIKDGQE